MGIVTDTLLRYSKSTPLTVSHLDYTFIGLLSGDERLAGRAALTALSFYFDYRAQGHMEETAYDRAMSDLVPFLVQESEVVP